MTKVNHQRSANARVFQQTARPRSTDCRFRGRVHVLCERKRRRPAIDYYPGRRRHDRVGVDRGDWQSRDFRARSRSGGVSTTGGKPRLMGISKRGNTYLRKLLIHGARAALPYVAERDTVLGRWAKALLARVHPNVRMSPPWRSPTSWRASAGPCCGANAILPPRERLWRPNYLPDSTNTAQMMC